jgi:hypothetical protein
MMNTYTAGTLITLSMSLVNASNVLTNATIALKIRTPDGVVTDISNTVQNPTVGEYNASFLTSQYGPHQYEWIATGALEVAQQGQFNVNPALF